MNTNFELDVIKSKDEVVKFYYRSIGDKIKRSRKKLNLTQEALAKGICSNTYVSKIENNKIAINKEHFNLLMEKMGHASQTIISPEKMVDCLEKSLIYFFYKDFKSYEKLFNDLDNYDYGVLIYLIRLGYYVLIEDYERAQVIHDDIHRYLNSFEDFGLSTLFIYSCFYKIGINDYKSARETLECIKNHLRNNEILYNMYSYLKFIVYGHLNMINESRDGFDVAKGTFLNYSNFQRISEAIFYNSIFRIYEGKHDNIVFNKYHSDYIGDSDYNLYIILLSEIADNPLHYLNHLKPEGKYYIDGLFLKARYMYVNDRLDDYKELKKEINASYYKFNSRIDYLNLLKLFEQDDPLRLKEYLIDYVLPYLSENQNLYFYKKTINIISKILSEKNRYKDSMTYYRKFEQFRDRLQKARDYNIIKKVSV